MQRMWSVVLGALLLAAGCTSEEAPDDGTGTDTGTGTGPVPPQPPLPPPIEDSQDVAGGADPFNFVTGAPCSTPASTCIRYAFQLNTTAVITAALSWGVPANDFDLHVMQEGVPADGASGTNQPPGTEEAFEVELEAGSYELVVVAWFVTQDTYTVSATFAYP